LFFTSTAEKEEDPHPALSRKREREKPALSREREMVILR